MDITKRKRADSALLSPSAKMKEALEPPSRIIPYLFLLPAMAVFALFSYLPFLKTIAMSFSITDNRGQIKKLVGLLNYTELLGSPEFRETLLTTLKFVPMIFFPTLLLGLFLACLAEKKLKFFSPISETLFALPMAVASASAAVVWKMLFNPSSGALNYLLGTDISWLADKNWALISVALVTVWLQTGITFIFLVTGLRGVPAELAESASIDGCGPLRTFFHIKLPMISPTLFFVVFLNITTSFQTFGQIRLLTQGGPGSSTTVLVYQIYQEAFMNKRYGSAGAMSIILFLLMLCITLIQFRFEKKGVFYG
ncbi:MAG: carbohydrate ABC transporter permease [Oscillospiraceae bacterium]